MAGAARGGQAGGTAPGSQTRVFGPAATAAGVLHNAALAALQLPAATPRPDQFVYSEVVQRWAGAGPHSTDQQWLSVDGTRFGLVKIVGNPNPQLVINHPMPGTHDARLPAAAFPAAGEVLRDER